MLGLLRGDHPAALEAFGALAARRPNVAWFECAVARELAASGRHAEARVMLEALAADGYRRLTENYELATLGGYFMLAEVCAELGDAGRAAELYARMLPTRT